MKEIISINCGYKANLILVFSSFTVGASVTRTTSLPRMRPTDEIQIVRTAVLHLNIDGPTGIRWIPVAVHLSSHLTLVFLGLSPL